VLLFELRPPALELRVARCNFPAKAIDVCYQVRDGRK
jgi:hypothetical protein